MARVHRGTAGGRTERGALASENQSWNIHHFRGFFDEILHFLVEGFSIAMLTGGYNLMVSDGFTF